MAVIIYGTGKTLPAAKMTNADFPVHLDTSDEWIRSHTGVSSRFIAGEGESGALLAADACRNALQGFDSSVKAQDMTFYSVLSIQKLVRMNCIHT